MGDAINFPKFMRRGSTSFSRRTRPTIKILDFNSSSSCISFTVTCLAFLLLLDVFGECSMGDEIVEADKPSKSSDFVSSYFSLFIFLTPFSLSFWCSAVAASCKAKQNKTSLTQSQWTTFHPSCLASASVTLCYNSKYLFIFCSALYLQDSFSRIYYIAEYRTI